MGGIASAGEEVGRLAERIGGRVIGPASLRITGLGTLSSAGPGDMTFIRTSDYARRWVDCRASAAVVSRGVEVPGHDERSRALVVVEDAEAAMVSLLELFARPPEPTPAGVHASCVVDASATVHPSASLGPLCVVGARSSIDAGATLVARVTLGRDVRIGAGTVLHPGVVVQDRCVIGRGCILHPGVVIGCDGFGYRPAPDGRGLAAIPHLGNVVIGDAVEIGANSCVDRAKMGSTLVGDGTKIDNLVQVGHNCEIGRACVLCGQVGLAGSAVLEDGVVLAGQVGVADHMRVGRGARVGAQGGVTKDLAGGENYWGTPARPARDYVRSLAELERLMRKKRK